jgi:lipopolysaccharide heptosyltransferase I
VRILLTRLSALGDVVHTWPLAEALTGGEHPAELAWVIEEPFLPLVAQHPAVALAIPVATRRWRRRPFSPTTRRELLEARRLVRSFAADVALDPQGLVKSAAWGLLSGARERVGLARGFRREALAGACYTRTVVPPAKARHVIDINLSLARAVGGDPAPGAAPDGSFLLSAAGRRRDPAPVVLLPATGGAGKAWSATSFAALAREIAGRGLPVTVAWGPGERALAEGVVAGAGGGATLAEPTTLAELAALLAGSAAVVGGDTGPVHLAAALGVPTTAVFVATDPERNGPRGRRVRVVTAARSGARAGRARSGTLREVAVAEVLDALLQLLEEPVFVSR